MPRHNQGITCTEWAKLNAYQRQRTKKFHCPTIELIEVLDGPRGQQVRFHSKCGLCDAKWDNTHPLDGRRFDDLAPHDREALMMAMRWAADPGPRENAFVIRAIHPGSVYRFTKGVSLARPVPLQRD